MDAVIVRNLKFKTQDTSLFDENQTFRISPSGSETDAEPNSDSADCLHHVYLRSAQPQSFTGPTNLFCVTLYNEAAPVLSATLHSLLKSVMTFDRRRPPMHSSMHSSSSRPLVDKGSSCICIVTDGNDRLAGSVKTLLVDLGLLPKTWESLHPGTIFHFSSHRPSMILAGLEHRQLAAQPLEVPVQFVVVVKPENRGKMNSHALFFGHLCARLKPSFCYQIDAGTMVHEDSVHVLVEQMNAQPDIGALATRVAPAAPLPNDGLLQAWQYLDFATQLASAWPAEVTSGHLSVLPGQYCVFRWQALHPESAGPGGAEEATTPVEAYLRGLHPNGMIERLMFRAEDRVIGNELLLAREQVWRLDYCVGAHATTDTCDTFKELLLQRRRWNNSAAACRCWLLGQWPVLLARTDRTARQKLKFSLAMLWQLLLLVQQAVTPVVAVCTWLLLGQAFAHSGIFLKISIGIAVPFSLALMSYTPQRLEAWPMRLYTGLRDTACLASVLLVALAILLSFNAGVALFIIGPGLLLAGFTAKIFPHDKVAVWRRFSGYWMINSAIQIVLLSYALYRLNDLSWGTKGLTQSAMATRRAMYPPRAAAAAQQAAIHSARQMRRLRNTLCVAWIAINLGVFWWVEGASGFVISSVSPVVELSQFSLLLTLAASSVFFIRKKFKVQGKTSIQKIPISTPAMAQSQDADDSDAASAKLTQPLAQPMTQPLRKPLRNQLT